MLHSCIALLQRLSTARARPAPLRALLDRDVLTTDSSHNGASVRRSGPSLAVGLSDGWVDGCLGLHLFGGAALG